MTEANSHSERLDRLEVQVVDMSRTLDRMQTDVDALLDALRNRIRNRYGA